jgi:hypothetical protein
VKVDESVESEKDSIQTDTLDAYMQKLDSLNNSGELRHVNVYKLGNMAQRGLSVAWHSMKLSKDQYTMVEDFLKMCTFAAWQRNIQIFIRDWLSISFPKA